MLNDMQTYINKCVKNAIEEDIGDKDITSQLIPKHHEVTVDIIARESGILCGTKFANSVLNMIDSSIHIEWNINEGQNFANKACIATIQGNAQNIFTAERSIINFLQLLSSTATITNQYVQKIKHTKCKLRDTRKTIPGLRLAQKYAVTIGGAFNKRIGLYDAFLIKENHIAATGSITNAIVLARKLYKDKYLEVEVENLTELEDAINAKPDSIMLDNFSVAEINKAVALAASKIPLEASGSITLNNISDYAETGVDYISTGAITKNIKAIDFSLLVRK